MNLLNKLTIKNLKLNKKRTVVTIIGIMLSVALITAIASMYASGIKSLIDYETKLKGNFHTVFYNVPVSDMDKFENNRNIETLNITKGIGYAKVDSKNEDKPYAYIKGFTKESLNNLSIRLVSGRLPENDNEIVIPTHLKTNGRLNLTRAIGDLKFKSNQNLKRHEQSVIAVPEITKIEYTDDIDNGDILNIDFEKGIIKNVTKNKEYKTNVFPEFIKKIIDAGGLMAYAKEIA